MWDEMAHAGLGARQKLAVTCIAVPAPEPSQSPKCQHPTPPKQFTTYDLPTLHPQISPVTMSGRLVATRLATLARRTPVLTPRLYTTHALPAGGLLRNEAGLRLIKRRPWPLGSYALHNVPATRSISFVRFIPKLVTKFATAGAAAGGAVIAGVSYIQYQAGRMYSEQPKPNLGHD